jgi:glyoxylase-like metal-dependent hydrolase (beta-lactamase superfamily II)
MKKNLVQAAQTVFGAIKPKLEPYENGKRVVDGVEVVAAPGHTPGHSALAIASGASQLFYITDAAHHAYINFPHPDWHVAFDTDPIQAAKSRRALLDRAAVDRVLVSGAHLPFPAVGHVKTQDNGFEWVPTVWEWTE